MIAKLIALVTIGLVNAGSCGSGNKDCCLSKNCCLGQEFIVNGWFDKCDESQTPVKFGLDMALSTDQCCSMESAKVNFIALTFHKSGGHKSVSDLSILAHWSFPRGKDKVLWLFITKITSGHLEGEYAFIRLELKSFEYLKKCSSLLGYSYLKCEDASIIINKKLNLHHYLSHIGKWEDFKTDCSHVCSGDVNVY